MDPQHYTPKKQLNLKLFGVSISCLKGVGSKQSCDLLVKNIYFDFDHVLTYTATTLRETKIAGCKLDQL